MPIPDSNVPLPPSRPKNNYSFPNDLMVGSRNFSMSFYFMDYRSQTTFGAAVGGIASLINRVAGTRLQTSYTPSGSIYLPVPKKINDVQTVVWDQTSGTQLAAQGMNGAGLGGVAQSMGLAADALGPLTGYAMNPFLFMQFKSPSFKEHTLTWTLTPNNEAESRTLREVVNLFKYYALPKQYGPIYDYPTIVFPQIHPSEYFTFKFKPCAIISVQADYTGAGGPSFFRNGAPTNVNLSIQLKEIELWTKNNYDG
jgi:hypothetical protein